MKDAQLESVAHQLKNIAEEIRKNLGGGFEESIYQNALAIELRRNKIEYLKEVNIEIFYKEESVGVDRPDFIITKIKDLKAPVILELKVADKITDDHRMQLKSYCVSLPHNKNPILKDFLGGILISFPSKDVKDQAKIKIFVVDKNFKVLVDEEKDFDKKKR